jgi:hypothetical protein
MSKWIRELDFSISLCQPKPQSPIPILHPSTLLLIFLLTFVQLLYIYIVWEEDKQPVPSCCSLQYSILPVVM